MDKVEEKTRSIQERLATAFNDPSLLGDGTTPAPSVPVVPAPGSVPSDAPPAEGGAPRYLRPPGAMAEVDYAGICGRCGLCVSACPAGAIVLDYGVADGLPHIVPRRQPCVICDDLACMKACPSGALAFVGDRSLIHMGVAKLDHQRCLRQVTGEDCQLCVTQCPIGGNAIAVDGDGRIEIRYGCTGCGVCEKTCPTEPASIWVEPER